MAGTTVTYVSLKQALMTAVRNNAKMRPVKKANGKMEYKVTYGAKVKA